MTVTRNLKAVGVSFDLLIDLMRQDYEVKDGIKNIEGVPADAKFSHCFPDETRGEVYFVFEHPSFPVVPLGAMIPTGRITLMRITPSLLGVWLNEARRSP